MGLTHVSRSFLSVQEMLPAVSQGALGLEVRAGDSRAQELIAFLDDPVTHAAVDAERGFLARLEGGCVVPVAGLAQVEGVSLSFEALIGDLDVRKIIRDSIAGSPGEADSLGRTLAERLLDQGGREILAQIYGRPI